jgi:transcriptional regulator with XRE-family HTH domain
MTAMAQEHRDARRVSARPASGITIDPEQLTRMRDLVPLSRDELAERTGELLFDREAFDAILAGRLPADARMARTLWLALDCAPRDLIPDLPPGLAPSDVARWLRGHYSWTLDRAAVTRLRVQRGWTADGLAKVVSRYWFSRDSVNKIERGERRPKAPTLRAFCQVLGCTPADLMPGSRELPEGETAARAAMLEFNEGMRAFADERGISYRNSAGRIGYGPELREAYGEYLAGQDAGDDGTP